MSEVNVLMAESIQISYEQLSQGKYVRCQLSSIRRPTTVHEVQVFCGTLGSAYEVGINREVIERFL